MDASAKVAEAFVGDVRNGYRKKFYLYGFIGIHDEWVERGFAETPEEVAAMLSRFDDLISHMPL